MGDILINHVDILSPWVFHSFWSKTCSEFSGKRSPGFTFRSVSCSTSNGRGEATSNGVDKLFAQSSPYRVDSTVSDVTDPLKVFFTIYNPWIMKIPSWMNNQWWSFSFLRNVWTLRCFQTFWLLWAPINPAWGRVICKHLQDTPVKVADRLDTRKYLSSLSRFSW